MQVPREAQPLIRAASFALLVFSLGLLGFTLLADGQHGFIDIVYMTVITLTTVGFGEVIDLSDNPAGRAFVSVLIISGVGGILYLLSGLAALLSNGNIQRLTWMRSRKRKAATMKDHIIVCGGGSIGTHVVDELHGTRREFVLIEEDEEAVHALQERVKNNFPAIIGDATQDDALQDAGIMSAAGVISCVGSDNNNLIIVMSARMLRPALRIVARCKEMALAAKLRRAGADSVVSPTTIGGLRLSSEMVRPGVVSFLDHMLHDKEEALRVEEWPISESSRFAQGCIGDLRDLKLDDFLVIALCHNADHWRFNPPDDEPLAPGMTVIFMGSPGACATLRKLDTE